MDEKGLGKRLQAARQAAGLTQQALCHKANLSYSTLAKIERGAIKSPSIFTIQSIAGALGVGLDDLLGQPSPSLPGRTLSQSKSGVRFVYFDVNGCLVRFYHRAFARIAEDSGVAADVVERACWHYNDDICKGIITMAEFNKLVGDRIGVEHFSWQEYYLEAAEAVPGMKELVSWTAERYKTGLLTNIMPGLLKGLQAQGKVPTLPYDALIDSSQVGVVKPQAHMFEIAEAQADVPPEHILLIDDTPSNLQAAGERGWHAMLFEYARPEESIAQIREVLEPVN